jgi:hypothetical protein
VHHHTQLLLNPLQSHQTPSAACILRIPVKVSLYGNHMSLLLQINVYRLPQFLADCQELRASVCFCGHEITFGSTLFIGQGGTGD